MPKAIFSLNKTFEGSWSAKIMYLCFFCLPGNDVQLFRKKLLNFILPWIVSSVGLEHYFDRVGATGSSPVRSTQKKLAVSRKQKAGPLYLILAFHFSHSHIFHIHHVLIRASHSTSTGCMAFLPVPSLIWCLQLVPGAAMIVSLSCLRTAGNNTSSPIFIESS